MFGLDDLLTGGMSLLGGVANNLFAGFRQSDQQAFSASQAQNQMGFQERMSSTAHQREVADLKAAGLNPILSVNHGASSPSGAMGSTIAAPVHDMLGPAVNTAMAHAKLKEEIANMQSTNDNIRANTRKSIIEGNKADEETKKVSDERAIVIENLMDAKTKAARAKIEHDQLNNPAYKILRQTGNIGEEVQRGSSALSNLPALINAKTRRDSFKERFGQ